MTNTDELALPVGKILLNLQSLEFALRLFLYETAGPKDASLQLHQLTVGEQISENPITNYDTLAVLISKVNKQLEILDIGERIDNQLVALRDAFAHGRTSALQPTGPYRLLKFSTAKQGKVQVTTVLDLTPQWLAEQTKRTLAELLKIVRIGRSIGLRCFLE